MRFLSSLLIVLLGTATSIPTSAAFAMPEPGTRIRVTALVPERERWIGRFVSAARGNGLRGASGGLAMGALCGAVVGYAAHGGNDNLVSSSAGESAAAGAVVFGVLGVAIGAAVGALTHSEHWRALHLENQATRSDYISR